MTLRFVQLRDDVPGTDIGKRPAHAGWRESTTLIRPLGNAGIYLRDEYVAVDIDRECPESEELERVLAETETWMQQSRRGRHYLYHRGSTPTVKNYKLYDARGEPFADVKYDGYIMAPWSIVDGHVYKRIGNHTPAMFAEVRDALSPYTRVASPDAIPQAGEAGGGVPLGEHDAWLTRYAGWLRGQGGLSEERIYEVMRKGALGALEGTDTSDPYTESDLRRIAHSAGSYAVEKANGTSSNIVVSAADYEDTHTRTVWLLDGYIPEGELVLQFGRGGIGKTTWLKWLAGRCITENKRVGFIVSEEPFSRIIHSIHATHSPSPEQWGNLFEVQGNWTIPDQVEELRTIVLKHSLDILYFDSIYTNFAIKDGMNAAEKARHALSSLVVLARETGCTVIGTFHENKAGQSLGSLEMENVPRVLIHATQKQGQNTILTVQKTNFRPPSHNREVVGEWGPELARDGTPIEEVMEDGTIQACQIFQVSSLNKVTIEDQDEDWTFFPEPTKEQAQLGEAEVARVSEEDILNKATLEDYRAEFPESRRKQARLSLGWSESKINKYWEFRDGETKRTYT